MITKKNIIAIRIAGGSVQEINIEGKVLRNTEFIVIDSDVDGADEEDLITVDNDEVYVYLPYINEEREIDLKTILKQHYDNLKKFNHGY